MGFYIRRVAPATSAIASHENGQFAPHHHIKVAHLILVRRARMHNMRDRG